MNSTWEQKENEVYIADSPCSCRMKRNEITTTLISIKEVSKWSYRHVECSMWARSIKNPEFAKYDT